MSRTVSLAKGSVTSTTVASAGAVSALVCLVLRVAPHLHTVYDLADAAIDAAQSVTAILGS